MKSIETDKLLENFEKGLNPGKPGSSEIPFNILGYGEISTVFTLEELPESAIKRMPLFRQPAEIKAYSDNYEKYCLFLKKAGVETPGSSLAEVHLEGRPLTLYIVQAKHDPESFCHKRIHDAVEDDVVEIFSRICESINRVWTFNKENEQIQLAIDGQLSNWILDNDEIIYVDTSTPLFKIEGQEQLDPALILNTAPGFLRWILKLFFLDDVMNRYYDPRSVFIDLVANLYKEQKPDLIPIALRVVNSHIRDGQNAISEKEIKNYYREDKIIWALFLAFRKLDRWIITKILGKRYEFILPGKIKR